jgi:hypothetical protein
MAAANGLMNITIWVNQDQVTIKDV